jgi:hypothetical protein
MTEGATAQVLSVQCHEPLQGLAKLMTAAYSGTSLAPLGAALVERATRDPDDANALMDLSIVLQLLGQRDVGVATQAQALAVQQLYNLAPAPNAARTLRVLALMTHGDLSTNAPLEFLAQQAGVSLDMLYVAADQPFPSEVPDHDVLYVAINEADQTQALLAGLQEFAQVWPRPVINLPARILDLARDRAYALVDDIPGVLMPLTARVARQTLEQLAQRELQLDAVIADASFPIILRPVGSHAGRGLMRCDDLAAVADYLRQLPDLEFFASRFIDYRSPDGRYRKYRIVLIDGRPFLCHMAVSAHWMVHYLNAGMGDDADKRAEEANCMAGFEQGFAAQHAAALQTIHERFGLEYLGLDCAETPDGQLLIFELDSGPIVHAMDAVDVFPYKQEPMRKVFQAFRGMLEAAMQRAG